MFEEDIFGEDTVTLVLRYNDYVTQNFDNLKSATIIQYTIKGRFMSR